MAQAATISEGLSQGVTALQDGRLRNPSRLCAQANMHLRMPPDAALKRLSRSGFRSTLIRN